MYGRDESSYSALHVSSSGLEWVLRKLTLAARTSQPAARAQPTSGCKWPALILNEARALGLSTRRCMSHRHSHAHIPVSVSVRMHTTCALNSRPLLKPCFHSPQLPLRFLGNKGPFRVGLLHSGIFVPLYLRQRSTLEVGRLRVPKDLAPWPLRELREGWINVRPGGVVLRSMPGGNPPLTRPRRETFQPDRIRWRGCLQRLVRGVAAVVAWPGETFGTRGRLERSVEAHRRVLWWGRLFPRVQVDIVGMY